MHHHDHREQNERRVLLVLLLTGSFMVVEVIGGLLSGSLALLADAGHMLTDTAALALAYGAFRISRRPADDLRTYGYDRFQVLAAFINGLVLIGVFGWIVWEAIHRMMNPTEVLAVPMLVVAILGLLVNLLAFRVLHPGAKDNLNIKGALLHVIFDILGSVGVIVAAVVIYFFGLSIIDPILSIFLAFLIVPSAWGLIKKATHILMEGTPDTFDVEALKKDLVKTIPGLIEVHHVHVWLLTLEQPLLTMHATIKDIKKSEDILVAIKNHLREKYKISHSTVQVENRECADHH